MNNNYELVVILNPELKAEEQEKLLSKVKKLITDAEGKILESKEWGQKDLSYSIAKKKTGIFHFFSFSLSSLKISSLKTKVSMEEKIIRFLLIKKE